MEALGVAYSHCENSLRQAARAQWLVSLYVDPKKRRYSQALSLFWHEIAGVCAKVSSPMAGEIRFQYWLDVLAGKGEVAGNPLALALQDTLARNHLPSAAATAMIEARIGDLYDDKMPNLAALEHYCGAIYGAHIRLNTLILADDGKDPGGAIVCGHAGMAIGLVDILGQMMTDDRMIKMVPPELLKMSALGGVHSARVIGFHGLEALAQVHLAQARAKLNALERAIQPAFLPLALIAPTLKRLNANGFTKVKTPPITALHEQWLIWRAARGMG